MPLTVEQQEEVDRAEALLNGLTDIEKQAVVLMSYRDSKGTLEQTIQIKRAKFEALTVRKAQVEDLATRTGVVLEPVVTVDTVVKSIVDRFGKVAVQAAIDALP